MQCLISSYQYSIDDTYSKIPCDLTQSNIEQTFYIFLSSFLTPLTSLPFMKILFWWNKQTSEELSYLSFIFKAETRIRTILYLKDIEIRANFPNELTSSDIFKQIWNVIKTTEHVKNSRNGRTVGNLYVKMTQMLIFNVKYVVVPFVKILLLVCKLSMICHFLLVLRNYCTSANNLYVSSID